MRYEAKRFLSSVLRRKRVTDENKNNPLEFSTWKIARAKLLLLKMGFAVNGDQPSWFYSAYDRGASDPLTNYTLEVVSKKINKDERVLVTGCGTGITAFALAALGFKNIQGVDVLDECVRMATGTQYIFDPKGYCEFLSGDGFRPDLGKQYDVITALHWVFSAWDGNYGNHRIENPKSDEVRGKLLEDLLRAYYGCLRKDGLFIVELIDGVADYRVVRDNPNGFNEPEGYLIRHSPDLVRVCCERTGFKIIDKAVCFSYGRQPRVAYYLRRA
jgi:SAM-dependent methyltransferase